MSLGTSPMGGSTPFGFGTPATASAPPAAWSRARYVNPTTRDWELGDDGEYRRMPVTRHRVLVSLTERRGSSTVRPGDGVALPETIDGAHARRVTFAVTDCPTIKTMTDREKTLRIDDVRVAVPITGRSDVTVSYTDLDSDERDSLAL